MDINTLKKAAVLAEEIDAIEEFLAQGGNTLQVRSQHGVHQRNATAPRRYARPGRVPQNQAR